MEQAYQYIKRLLVFGICIFLYLITARIVPLYVSVPVLLLTFSLLHSRITGEKPPHLFAFYRTDTYFKKGGLRDLIRIFVTLFGFIYDAVIWTFWGIYLVFLLFIDLIDLLKTIFYWIIHALLWFLRQYVPFFVLLYRLFIHYLIHWPWWLYQTAYYNIRYAFNKNSYRVAFSGTILVSLIIFIFYYLETVLIKIPGITYIGMIISLLPLTWSFGEIAAMRVNKLESEKYTAVRLKFQNGIEAVRSILFYITLFVVLLLAQLGLNLLGWISVTGITIAGFVFNINTLISLLLIFISVLIVFGVVIIPSYRLYSSFSEIRLADTVYLLKTTGRKVLQYIAITVPVSFFSLLITVIPFVIVFLAGIITYNIKNFTTDLRIENLKTQQASSDNPVAAYSIGKKIEHLEYLKKFPLDLTQNFLHRETLATELIFAREDFKSDNEEALRQIEEYKKNISQVQTDLKEITDLDPADPAAEDMKSELASLQEHLKSYESTKQTELAKLAADINFLQQRIRQILLMILFGGLWLVIFGSMVAAFIISYLGNVYHQLFIFRNDGTPAEWKNIVSDIRKKDHRQPLLGGTLFFITTILVFLIIKGFVSFDGLIRLMLSLLRL
jgi:hypothetical protein